MKSRFLRALVVCAALFLAAIMRPSALTNAGSITTFGAPLTENFDGLASTGTGIAWTDSSTISSWYASRPTYNSGTGSSNAGALYSFGVAGQGPVGDRAFGSVGSGPTGTIYWAVKLTNNTGGTITSLNVSYVGEQWRNGGAAAPALSVAQTVDFQYQIANAGAVTAANTPGTGWIDHDSLDFTSPTFGTSAAAALDGNAAANRLAKSATLTVTIASGQEMWLRWRDVDHAGNDHGLAIDDLSVTANGVETAPIVTGTVPASGASNLPLNSAIVIKFSERVDAGADAFDVQCPTGATQGFIRSASPASSYSLTPTPSLPPGTTCTVSVVAAQITDTDANDPPDAMASDFTFSFTTGNPPPPGAASVRINEIDADTPGSDTNEFIELYDGGVGNTSLDGLVVVFYTGDGDNSYATFDLDGYTTNANGYFILGNPAVPGVNLSFDPGAFGLLQNGPDAVALYAGSAADFPIGTSVTLNNLQDAVVYGTDDADDAGLLALLNEDQPQVNENGGGSATTQSSQRCPDGSGGPRNTSSYGQSAPTPGLANTCPAPPPPNNSAIVISQLYGGGGNSGATYQRDYVELFNKGTATVDLGGWTLQYASATGNGWDFNKQPLGGAIAPGQYFLIALASNGAIGASLPPANVSGLINMSGTAGKVALVGSFDALVGNCPTANPHLMDLVGYGTTADCREGTTTAPVPGNTTSLFRLGGGSTDTNSNGSDFVTGAPSPRRTAPIVELGPAVLGTDPRTGGSNAPRDATITVTFTEPVSLGSAWFDLVCVSSGPHTDATFASSGQSHYITPNVNFAPGEQCIVTISKDQIHDLDLDDSGPNTDTLRENYAWTFTVASGTAPPDLPGVHLTMGNPSGATTNTGHPNNYLMEKPEYVLSYNRDFGRPNWVSWHLSDEWIGSLGRVDTFRPDPAVPADWYRVHLFDFAGSGFDRGHMTPNADRDKETSIPINQATFLMSNMVAQAPDNNQGPWASLEEYLRTLTPASEIYVVAGGAGAGGSGSNGGVTTTLAGGRLTIPAQTWKVALVLPKGIDDVSRVSCSSRTIAVIMPNVQGIRNTPWETYLTTVDAVETLTGYDLFSNLPRQIQACVEAGTNGSNPPLDSTAPGIVCAAPDNVWHRSDVALACTASDGGSGLANPADAAFTLVTAVAPNAEDANAVTNSRVVCDVAGNCSTAGPIAGNKIDRKDPVISGVTATPSVLGPVNHKLIDVTVGYEVADSLSGAGCSLLVTSNEAPNAKGDGNTAVDWLIVDAHRLQLRSERDGGGSGRVYTITIGCVDGAGNTSSATTTVTVPK